MGYKHITIKKGWHSRLNFKLQTKFYRAFSFMFIDESKYLFETNDQQDWNKLWGMYSFQWCWPMSHADCGMIGWRYNPAADNFEITPYTHGSCGERKWEAKPIKVSDFEVVQVQIMALNDEWAYNIQVRDQVHYYTHNRTKGARVYKQMNGYFGGNNPAPSDITYLINEHKERIW